eukprot:TRINITY_DN6433_c0_g1_i9.p2 TRINITY_DN6433_c0_g1~~TRINITY_DN6433_c0_g1_i9.p2  ORF type:complete len:337 (+),score=62.94 TRINITY_DN6433_c0_g1_i9:1016-2026(+)
MKAAGIAAPKAKIHTRGSIFRPNDERMNEIFEQNISWSNLSFVDQMKLLDIWFLIGVIGNFIQILASICGFLAALQDDDIKVQRIRDMLTGFGCMLAWVYSMKFLSYIQTTNMLVRITVSSFGNVCRFFLGMLPFFIGYAFLGLGLLASKDAFSTLSKAFITLYALMNADNMMDYFKRFSSVGLIAMLFQVTYVIMFFTSVQNVFIFIIMEGYDQGKEEESNELDHISSGEMILLMKRLDEHTKGFASRLKYNEHELNNLGKLQGLQEEKDAITSHITEEFGDVVFKRKSELNEEEQLLVEDNGGVKMMQILVSKCEKVRVDEYLVYLFNTRWIRS